MVSSEDWYDITHFKELVLEERWKHVISAYENDSEYHKVIINESRGTALHVAVNDGNVELVSILVEAILRHEGRGKLRDDSALRSTNERGNTPLHLAASRGFIGMCKFIIGENGERKDLIRVRNKKRETPIFKAVLTGERKAFLYLYDVSKDLDVSLTNDHEDTILHKSIWRESLDLAIIINHCYPGLVNIRNNDDATPLKVLACRPSAFKSGNNLPWWKQILYYFISVEPLDVVQAINSYMEEVKKEEPLDAKKTKILYMEDDHEHKVDIEGKKAQICVEPKYVTLVRSVKSIARFALKCLWPSGWVVTLDLEAIKKIKQKHIWSGQLLTFFMENPYMDIGIAGGTPSMKYNRNNKDIDSLFITTEQLKGPGQQDSTTESETEKNKKILSEYSLGQGQQDSTTESETEKNKNERLNEPSSGQGQQDNTTKSGTKKKENERLNEPTKEMDKDNAFLTAAKNGIMEIVLALKSKIPSVMHETNSNNENVLLVAVKNRQTKIVEELKINLDKKLFDNLILEVDDMENTVLHLASGTTTHNERTWQIAGSAMQMMWDIKWYEYVRALVPEHFTSRTNNDKKTSTEVFKLNHEVLLKESSEWMKETSNSCSVVAALIAGVSFATSSTVPGGTNNGKPELEGQPAFDVFAIASLIGLCFSVTALIMFLAILTSRKQFQDFKMSLPLKLLFGLSSLFVSISSMLLSFCAGHFFVLKDKYKNILFPVYIATCLPITFYAVLQFPLYADLLRAIFKKVPQPSTTSSNQI
ncbi:uncharacterized protein [Phaseolus vulgaris]|uniref:uncharacterized protein isoform X2 n=1 Tax=Phaseolus vulgaris TaxID=3885 RepID=UPI0035CAC32D